MILYKMMISLILVVALVTISRGNIIGTYPEWGACLCFNANSVDIRSQICDGEVIGSGNTSECYKFILGQESCDPHGDFRPERALFRIDWGGKEGWVPGVYLNEESNSSCPTLAVNPDEYTCQVTDEGMRVHESSNTTVYDCVDSDCENNCKGGQSVAYVKCRCTKDGKYLPDTKAWSPGQKVTVDGECNMNIAENTAIATFDSNGEYTGHAAVFIKCDDSDSIQVYDQWCGRSVGYSTYGFLHPFYLAFATIRSFSSGPTSISCRNETSGSTECAACYSSCANETCST